MIINTHFLIRSLRRKKASVVYRCPCQDCDKVYIGETRKKLGERIKQHTAETASNQSAIHEKYKLTGHSLDKGNVTVLLRKKKKKKKKKTFPEKSERGNLYQERTQPHPKWGGGKLSRLYDSLLATPSSVRIPPTSKSGESDVSQHSDSIR